MLVIAILWLILPIMTIWHDSWLLHNWHPFTPCHPRPPFVTWNSISPALSAGRVPCSQKQYYCYHYAEFVQQRGGTPLRQNKYQHVGRWEWDVWCGGVQVCEGTPSCLLPCMKGRGVSSCDYYAFIFSTLTFKHGGLGETSALWRCHF